MAQAVYGSMYYILSSTRHDWPYGLSPGGLPGGEEYMGHTFWDQDIWMYPPLVLLHPDLARSSLKYRKDRLPAARRIAKEYGYKGNRTSVWRLYLYIHCENYSTYANGVLWLDSRVLCLKGHCPGWYTAFSCWYTVFSCWYTVFSCWYIVFSWLWPGVCFIILE